VCNTCAHILIHPYEKNDKSNSSVWKHYRKHEGKSRGSAQPPPNQPTIDSLLARPQMINSSDLNRILLQTTVTCNWPFDQFDIEIFRHLLHCGFPGHKIPNRLAIRRYLTPAADKAREEIKSRFEAHEGRISLALDCWTSSNRHEFMGTVSPIFPISTLA